MNVLLDDNVPIALKKRWSHPSDVLHCLDLGWDRLLNGDLVRAANERFEAMVTIDKNMAFQTPLKGLNLAVLVLDVRSNKLAEVLRFLPSLTEALPEAKSGTYHWVRL